MSIAVNLEPIIHLTSKQFVQLCQVNPELKLELTARGQLVVMPPTGGESGIRNSWLTTQLTLWAKNNGTGVVFDSSTMFELPNMALRSPDAAWIALSRWNALNEQQKETFPPIVPDFVAELRSKSDRLKELQDKMQEYMDNGVKLGWLLDPVEKRVEIYRIGQSKEVLFNPTQLSGESLLSGFVLDLLGII